MEQDVFKSFMKEVIEFFALMRASEKERYELLKKFTNDSIKMLRDIGQAVKKDSDYLRENMEKLKQLTIDNIDLIRTEAGADSFLKAREALEESLEVFQRTIQIMEYHQTLQQIGRVLEVKKLKRIDSELTKKRASKKEEE